MASYHVLSLYQSHDLKHVYVSVAVNSTWMLSGSQNASTAMPNGSNGLDLAVRRDALRVEQSDGSLQVGHVHYAQAQVVQADAALAEPIDGDGFLWFIVSISAYLPGIVSISSVR